MNKLQEAASNVQHLAKTYAAVIELGKYLENVGSLENLETEIRQRIVALQEDEVKARAAKSDAEHAHKQALAEHVVQIEALQSRALVSKQRAVAEAQEIVDRAEAEAQKILGDANTAASAAAEAKDQLENEFHEFEGAIAERGAELKTLNDEIAAIKAKFA